MADSVSRDDVLAALAALTDPATGRDIVSAGLVKGLAIRGGHVGFALEVAPADGPRLEPLRKAAERAVEALPGVLSVTAVLTAHSAGGAPARGKAQSHAHAHAHAHDHAHAHAPAPGKAKAEGPRQGPADVPGVGAIIAVASGKGGVGKSTLAVNLALALKRLGLRTGLLDADIYGPSVPRLLGLSGKPESTGEKLKPMEAYGLKTMSIGFLVGEDQPMIWRGPMVMTALTQLLTDVDWAPLDVLVVDMPPGTGDAQLTLVQRVPLAGAVIVSTPQEIALIDARKGLAMFRKTHVPVFGIVENMAWFDAPGGERIHIFGEGGARRTANELGCDFLGEVPLVPRIRETSDAGTPIVALDPDGPDAAPFLAIAQKVIAQLAAGAGGKGRQPPKIVYLD